MKSTTDRIIEVARVGPKDRLIIHLHDTDDHELGDVLAKELDRLGLRGRALVLTGDMTLKVVEP